MEGLERFLSRRCRDGHVNLDLEREAVGRFGRSLREVEETALALGILPARYRRNQRTFTTQEQLKMLRSSVAVVGCGGLGGYVIEQLSRIGVGRLVVVDPDVFEEHNLNRQAYCVLSSLGRPKVEEAAKRVRDVNPVVEVVPFQCRFSKSNARELLEGAHVAVDCLDSVTARLDLSDACNELDVPLIHGSIGGWYGQVHRQSPGRTSLRTIYGDRRDAEGIEAVLGNPSFTPGVVAGFQVAEAVKALLGYETPLVEHLLFIDLLEMKVELIGM